MSMTRIMTEYNNYMVGIFGDNDYLISVITLAVMGFGAYVIKVVPNFIKHQMLKHLSTVVTIDSTNEAYHIIMQDLEKKGVTKKARYLTLINGMHGYDELTLIFGGGEQFLYLYGVFCHVKIIKKDLENRIVYEIVIRTAGRNHNLAKLLRERGQVRVEKQGYIQIRDFASGGTVEQLKESLDSVIIEDKAMEQIKEIIDFTEKEEWYLENGIPYHLGVLIYGKPGMGKTKLIRVLLSSLGYEIFILTSVSELGKIPKRKKVVIVMEEVDGMFTKRKSTSGSLEETVEEPSEEGLNTFTVSEQKPRTERYEEVEESFSDSINASIITRVLSELDGIVQSHGRIIIMTTNHPEKLDKAVLRPGRIDIKIELKSIKIEEFKKFYTRYYKEVCTENNLVMKTNTSGADLQLAFRVGKSKEEFIEMFTKSSN